MSHSDETVVIGH